MALTAYLTIASACFCVCPAVDGKRCLRAAIWERGAGYTLASGSSSCAVGAAAALLHRCIDSENVEVHMQGGLLRVSVTAASNSSGSDTCVRLQLFDQLDLHVHVFLSSYVFSSFLPLSLFFCSILTVCFFFSERTRRFGFGTNTGPCRVYLRRKGLSCIVEAKISSTFINFTCYSRFELM